jgi:hypothetical protein
MAKYFTREEFDCQYTGKNEMKDEFIEKLDALREKLQELTVKALRQILKWTMVGKDLLLLKRRLAWDSQASESLLALFMLIFAVVTIQPLM